LTAIECLKHQRLSAGNWPTKSNRETDVQFKSALITANSVRSLERGTELAQKSYMRQAIKPRMVDSSFTVDGNSQIPAPSSTSAGAQLRTI